MDWESTYYELKNGCDGVPSVHDSIDFGDTAVHENIYSAATVLYLYYNSHNDIYRGQANENWELTPTLFRNDTLSIDDEIKKLSSFVRFLQHEYGFEEEDALAVAKHYSPEAGIKSWLLDITYDYEVACYFASDPDPDRAGEIGEIYMISPSEIEKFRTSTAKSVGDVKLYSPDGVARIEKQSAGFIDRCHPALLNGYVHWKIPFVQRSGIKFENKETKITKEELFPPDDEFKKIAEDWKKNNSWEEIGANKLVTPPHLPNEEVRVDDYFIMTKLWLEEGNENKKFEDLTDRRQEFLFKICVLHKYCQENNFSDTAVSLHNLYNVSQSDLFAFTKPNPIAESSDRTEFRWVVDQYYQKADQLEKPKIERKIEQLDPDS